jgi:hypothetical protein
MSEPASIKLMRPSGQQWVCVTAEFIEANSTEGNLNTLRK